jgi:hypothetical protein
MAFGSRASPLPPPLNTYYEVELDFLFNSSLMWRKHQKAATMSAPTRRRGVVSYAPLPS